jgi:DNA invertase Pin-like site-specific DNA recombinase
MGKPLTGERAALAIRLTKAGVDTQAAIAKQLGCSAKTLRTFQRKNGLPTKRGRKGGYRKRLTPKQGELIRRLLKETRLTFREIADAVGVSPSVVGKILSAGKANIRRPQKDDLGDNTLLWRNQISRGGDEIRVSDDKQYEGVLIALIDLGVPPKSFESIFRGFA